jgi:pentatricopeptide repeat protein
MSSNIFVTAYDSTAKNFAEIFCVMIRKVLIVQLLLQNEPERAVRILAKMKRMNVKPNRRTYEILFSFWQHQHSLRRRKCALAC